MASEQKTVLTVDDSKVVRTMVARALEKYGCRVIEATNGREAIAAAEQHKPDLILLDVTMPEMDGRQALALLREREACRRIPVIMLTAERTRELIIEVARLGVAGYLLKPFDQPTFDREVGKVLGPPLAIDRETVLVVDDSERVLAAARAALEGTMKVLTAASGQEAVQRYTESRPGVVVVDLAMPEMDGFETLARLRPLGRSAYVALTVRGDEAGGGKALKAGYQSLLAKPFQAQGLMEAVQAAVASLSSPEEVAKALLEDDGTCAVLVVPDPTSTRLARLLPVLRTALRGLAEDGGDKLVIDLAALTKPDAEATKSVGQLAAEVVTLGLQLAFCAGDAKLHEELQKLPGLRDVPYAGDRAAARQALGAGPVPEADAAGGAEDA
jgi:CheY-like chemotaxis protein